MKDTFYNLLKEEKKKGTTIFYSTHILSEVSKICDKVGIIKEGKLIEIKNIEELTMKDLLLVAIISKDKDKIKKDLNLKIIYEDDNSIKFSNNLDCDELIKTLAKYKIDKILIEEQKLEDIFLHYYKEGDDLV